jgi:SAM-dependent methyltransferase
MMPFEAERKLYSPYYFRKEFSESNSASAVMVPLILEAISVHSVLDVGCGVGAFLRRFRNHGVIDIVGVDGDYIPDWLMKVDGKCFHQHDLKTPLHLDRRFDLVVCLEVAEHLPESVSDILIASICEHGDVVVFSAAVPGQGGVCHVNEQPHRYWEQKFAMHGYRQIDWLRPRLKDREEIAPWYRKNTFFYVSADGLKKNPKLKS